MSVSSIVTVPHQSQTIGTSTETSLDSAMAIPIDATPTGKDRFSASRIQSLVRTGPFLTIPLLAMEHPRTPIGDLSSPLGQHFLTSSVKTILRSTQRSKTAGGETHFVPEKTISHTSIWVPMLRHWARQISP